MESTYHIRTAGQVKSGRFYIDRGTYESPEYFCGYSFMGDAIWSKTPDSEFVYSKEEALQIIKDLEAADE